MSWYYAREGRQVGPVSEAELQAQVAAGVVRPDTLVWREGMASWQPYGGVAGDAGTAPRKTCSQCGRAFPADDLIDFGDRSVCAECKPVFLQGLKEGAIPRTQLRYGGFWIRFGAYLIDTVILWVVGFVLQLPITMWVMRAPVGGPPSLGIIGLQLVATALQFFLVIAYQTLFVGRFGATPGKMVCGLRVVTADGGRVTYARALARYFSTIISALTLMIGFVMAAFDEEKRALHDRICDTRVVRG
jgi:uncharacterized RDD family membrane protein YckC